MKKLLLMLLALSVLTISPTVSAHERGYNDGPSSRHEDRWQEDRHNHDRDMPFKWHEKREKLSPANHRLERIKDKEFKQRFHGLKAYRWHTAHHKGFWYKGHFITDAVLFFDKSDELVRIGFMRDGVFVIIHSDHSCHEHRDHFFVSWWSR